MSAGTAETRSGSGRQPASAVANGDGPQTTDNRENIVTTSEQQAVPVAQEQEAALATAFYLLDTLAGEGLSQACDDGRTIEADDTVYALCSAFYMEPNIGWYRDLAAELAPVPLPCKSGEGAEKWEGPAYEYGVTWGPDDAHPDATQTREAEGVPADQFRVFAATMLAAVNKAGGSMFDALHAAAQAGVEAKHLPDSAPAREGALAHAVTNILPIGDERAPGDKVIPIYVRMDELRAIRELAALNARGGA